jgi:vanillate O-demethylase monooxygenase subunit
MEPEHNTARWARGHAVGEQAITHEIREGVARIFKEDELVLEAQQRAVDDFPERSFYDLNIDAGGVWARRQIASMIEAERAPNRCSRAAAVDRTSRAEHARDSPADRSANRDRCRSTRSL